MDGQFAPGQAIQFEGELPPRSPWHRYSMIDVINRQGLTSGLKLCLDAADASSYTSGQSWLDLSGNGYDFFRGATNSATTDDPTFNGSAGGRSSAEHWSFDGGDYFGYDTANETWMQNLHKDNAAFTILTWVNSAAAAAARAIAGSCSINNTQTGINFNVNATDKLTIQVMNASGTGFALNVATAASITEAAWQMLAVTIDEAAGTGSFVMNGTAASFTSTYTTPTAGSATRVLALGCNGVSGGANLFPSGSLQAIVAAWEGTALTAAQLAQIFTATRGRFGV